MGFIIAGCGLFSVCGAAFDWEFFMNHRKARRLVRLVGRTGARIFYGILGGSLAVAGLLMAAGIIGR